MSTLISLLDLGLDRWDQQYIFDNVSHSEYYDMTGTVSDPEYNFDHPAWWQMKNEFSTLPIETQEALHKELQSYYECRGSLRTPSNCP